MFDLRLVLQLADATLLYLYKDLHKLHLCICISFNGSNNVSLTLWEFILNGIWYQQWCLIYYHVFKHLNQELNQRTERLDEINKVLMNPYYFCHLTLGIPHKFGGKQANCRLHNSNTRPNELFFYKGQENGIGTGSWVFHFTTLILLVAY